MADAMTSEALEDRAERAAPARPDAPTVHDGSAPAVAWPQARRIARTAAAPLSPVTRPLADALGHVIADPLTALTDLPSFDTSAMDGWAVAGPGPWRLAGERLAGQESTEPLPDGEAVRIATGAALPPGATAVLRRERGRTAVRGGAEWLHAERPPVPAQDVRPRGQECRTGDRLLPPGTLVTPGVLGLAAAAGYDQLAVVPRPCVDVLVLGDELLHHGTPRGGRVRDALGPLLAPWLRSLGAEASADSVVVRHLGDDLELLHRAIGSSTADLIVTTGGTAAGPVDFVRPVLRRLGARSLVDGVAVRPGHPMLLALLPTGRPLVGLPGNPLAAVSGVVTLAAPLLRALSGRREPESRRVPMAEPVSGHPVDTRLVPVRLEAEPGVAARPLRFHGPAMLRGLAAADALAVIPPDGAAAGDPVRLLATGWERQEAQEASWTRQGYPQDRP